MPIDLITAFNKTTNAIANKSKIGYVFGHPIWFAFIILGTLVIIMWFYGVETPGGMKFWIYLGGTILGLVVAHDIIMVDQIKECMETKSGLALVGGIQTLSGVQPFMEPRKPEDVRLGYAPPPAAPFQSPPPPAAPLPQPVSPLVQNADFLQGL